MSKKHKSEDASETSDAEAPSDASGVGPSAIPTAAPQETSEPSSEPIRNDETAAKMGPSTLAELTDGLARMAVQARRWLLRDPSRRERRWNARLAIGLAVLGPVLAVLTYGMLSNADQAAIESVWFLLVKIADIIYLAVLILLIGVQIARIVIARRARSAGSKMHMRMVAMFAGIAALPTLLVAAFFIFVVQLSFDAWFSDQVGSVVRNSRDVAQAYAAEHRQAIRGEAIALAQRIDANADRMIGGVDDRRFPILLEAAIEDSNFTDVYILNSSAEVIARGSLSFLFAYTPPTLEDLARARTGALVIHEDFAANEMRALVRLDALFDSFLYVTRPVDGDVLRSLETTNRSVAVYNRLEQNRDSWLVQFAAIYLGFALLVVMAAIYLGLWFAERIARPIGRLAAAAQRIRSGDLYVRVKEERGEDEIALLSRTFNRMTEEVKRKQDALTIANTQLDDRRRFTEAVLSGVTAGVVGLDSDGRVRLLNRAAATVLGVDPNDAVGERFVDIAPECASLIDDAAYDPSRGLERSIRLVRGNRERELLIRVTSQREAAGGGAKKGANGGYVVTLDDLTALVSAQRMAAWGDVARRIAHEIKNPLTPIQLAAERLRRKYRDRLGEDGESFERYTETIVRQTGDIGRMVDAFVRFAKMPTPKMAVEPIEKLVREAMLLQEEGRAEISYSFEGLAEPLDSDGAPLAVRCDRGQLLQALTNMLQNAADAIHGRQAKDAEAGETTSAPGEIRVRVAREDDRSVAIEIEDNGVGLPNQDRRRLLEPYVTTREKGAGLGLAIVSKIVEEHSATFELRDAEPFAPGAHPGACARLVLPLASALETSELEAGDETQRQGGSTARAASELLEG